MTDQSRVEQPELSYHVSLEHFEELGEEFSTALVGILNNAGLAQTLVSGLLQQLPDPDVWRLTISGDVVATVNAIEQRDEGNAYTLDRGAGQVGARTINAHDGTYDIVIGAWSLMPAFDASSVEELVEYMHSIGLHLVIHEAGHVVLHQRGEDSEAFQELAGGTETELVCRKHLAAHIDDFRIEKMTNRAAPSPLSQVDGLGDTLAHMRSELTKANVLRFTDGENATFLSSTAVNDLVRVMTYLAAELSTTAQPGEVKKPSPLPDHWNIYVEDVWDVWVLTLNKLKPADEPMAVEEIADILTELCAIVVEWMKNVVGYYVEINEDGTWTAYWNRSTY